MDSASKFTLEKVGFVNFNHFSTKLTIGQVTGKDVQVKYDLSKFG